MKKIWTDDEIVEAVLRDARRQVEAGHFLDMHVYGVRPLNSGKYRPSYRKKSRVCFVGATLLSRRSVGGKFYFQHTVFADIFGKDEEWGMAFQDAVLKSRKKSRRENYLSGFQVGEACLRQAESESLLK